MWHFLLDHWWLMTIPPYFAYNIYLVHITQRDEGPLDLKLPADVIIAITFILIGVWLVATAAIFQIIMTIVDFLAEFERPTNAQILRTMRKYSWAPFFVLGAVISYAHQTTIPLLIVIGSWWLSGHLQGREK